MASYALQRHLGWNMQSRLGQKKERRAKVGNNNGQLRIANATSCGARKAAWANKFDQQQNQLNSGKQPTLKAVTLKQFNLVYNVCGGW